MNEIAERARAAGRALDDVDLARLSPAIHADINLNGRYHIHPDQPPVICHRVATRSRRTGSAPAHLYFH